MRVLSSHLSPLERQVQESSNITKAMKVPDECLNRKSEWGGTKIPDIIVSTPKGVVTESFGKENEEKGRKEAEEEVNAARKLREAIKQGRKRLRYLEDDTKEESDEEEEEEEGSSIEAEEGRMGKEGWKEREADSKEDEQERKAAEERRVKGKGRKIKDNREEKPPEGQEGSKEDTPERTPPLQHSQRSSSKEGNHRGRKMR